MSTFSGTSTPAGPASGSRALRHRPRARQWRCQLSRHKGLRFFKDPLRRFGRSATTYGPNSFSPVVYMWIGHGKVYGLTAILPETCVTHQSGYPPSTNHFDLVLARTHPVRVNARTHEIHVREVDRTGTGRKDREIWKLSARRPPRRRDRLPEPHLRLPLRRWGHDSLPDRRQVRPGGRLRRASQIARPPAPRLFPMAAAFLVVRGETASGIAHPIAGSLTIGRGDGVDLSLRRPRGLPPPCLGPGRRLDGRRRGPRLGERHPRQRHADRDRDPGRGRRRDRARQDAARGQGRDRRGRRSRPRTRRPRSTVPRPGLGCLGRGLRASPTSSATSSPRSATSASASAAPRSSARS